MGYSAPEDWQDHWKNQGITSFGDLFPENYDGSIREFWQARLGGPLESLVDIGCGNGALTWIADEILNQPVARTRITGIDFTGIDPFGTLGRSPADFPQISFVGNTPAEDLPFAAESVDMVISQYGIEYTDLERSIPEAVRILRRSGRMAFLMHAAESSVVEVATMHLRDFRAVHELGIHDYALRLHELGCRLPTPEARAASEEIRELTAKLDALTAQVRFIVKDYKDRSPIHVYMNALMGIFAKGHAACGDDEARQLIIGASEKFQARISRIEHMQAAALTADRLQRLIDLIRLSGASVTSTGTLGYRHEANIGTTLVATR